MASWATSRPSNSTDPLPSHSEITEQEEHANEENLHHGEQNSVNSSGLEATSSIETQGTTLNTWMTGEKVLKAEALWSMYTTVNHISNQASNNTSALFEVMFNVSKIAKQFTCAKDKNSYMAAFGLAPYFSELLCQSLSECPIYSISFHEAYNRVTKKEQLDLAIRYWDKKRSFPATRYMGSECLGHSTAENLLASFKKATFKLEHDKIINVSMDGPAVNHKFLRLLQAQRAQQSEYIYSN